MLRQFVSEDTDDENILEIIEKIFDLVHAIFSKVIFNEFCIRNDRKKNTQVHNGRYNLGKTLFLDTLFRKFPYEQFIQTNRSHFDIDYRERAKYYFSKYYLWFILIGLGAYHSLFDKWNNYRRIIFIQTTNTLLEIKLYHDKLA